MSLYFFNRCSGIEELVFGGVFYVILSVLFWSMLLICMIEDGLIGKWKWMFWDLILSLVIV